MREFYYSNNELWCEERTLRQIVGQYGTPLYVYSKQSIMDHCRHIEKGFGSTDHLTCYAVKANSNRHILSVIANEGIGCDAGSIGELHLALQAGFPADRITYSGVGKRQDEIEFGLLNDILAFNVESEEEIEAVNNIAVRLNKQARILLRVNFDIQTDTHPYITTSRKHNKFGVASSKAEAILRHAMTLQGIAVTGIHIHLGSQITDVKTFVSAARTVTEFVFTLRKQGIPMRHLNFGGGFGVQYHDFITHPALPKSRPHTESEITVTNFIEAVASILSESQCRILIQPGRSIVAHAGILVTKVLYNKESFEKKFVIVDAGMNDFIRPTLYQSYHQIVPLQIHDTNRQVVDVVGPLCESGDFFANDRELPVVGHNDYLALMCTGAYGYVLSSNYNARPRPAEVMIEGKNVTLIRERESLQQL